MPRYIWPMLSLFVVLFVAALPTRARPQIVYDLGQISRSMQMYVYTSSGPLTEDARFNSTTGAFNESATLMGVNTSGPWQIDTSHNSFLGNMSITGSGSVGYSTNNDDKTEIGLTSNLYTEFSVDESVDYSFASSTSGFGFVSFDNLTAGMPMPSMGTLMPGNTYLLFAEAVRFAFSPPFDESASGSWGVELLLVPGPGGATLALAAAWINSRRRRLA